MVNFYSRMVCVVVLVVLCSACETLNFYRQAAWGQLQIMTQRQPVERLITQADTPSTLKQQLQQVQDILDFASGEMGLDTRRNYRSYVDLPRSSVVWNVFAAPVDSLEAKTWCYPIAGCAPYRGFFKEAAARAYARELREEGYETYVGGVPAYSTLGWFSDPLLSTFIDWPAPDLTNLLIHELAHSRVWVTDDVAFNESFASFVGEQGLVGWARHAGQSDQVAQWRARRSGWVALKALLSDTADTLRQVYASVSSTSEVRFRKEQVMTALRSCYAVGRASLGAGRFDALVGDELNNAYLVSLNTYTDWVPAFRALFEQAGSDWQAFFSKVEQLGQLPQQQREAGLMQLASTDQYPDQRGYGDNTEQVHCEAFPGHGANAE